jgi:hypothetical protein
LAPSSVDLPILKPRRAVVKLTPQLNTPQSGGGRGGKPDERRLKTTKTLGRAPSGCDRVYFYNVNTKRAFFAVLREVKFVFLFLRHLCF